MSRKTTNFTRKIRVSQTPRGQSSFAQAHVFLIYWKNQTLRNPSATPLDRAAAWEISSLACEAEGDVAGAAIASSEAYAVLERFWRGV
jgi:hypothetical protein